MKMRLLELRILLIVAFAASGNTAFAGEIDSLDTKGEVQQFLASKCGTTGLIYLHSCSSIPHTRYRSYYLGLGSYIDSVIVVDPVTNKWFAKAIQRERDSSCNCCNDTTISPANYPLDGLNLLKNESIFNYYKTDIDGNGRTDLIVDVGSIVVVLDNNGGFEGHLLGYYLDSPTAKFQGYVSLPDGSAGLVFERPACFSEEGKLLQNSSIDTIVYRFHGFARYNRQLSSPGIVKITYRYSRSGLIECGDASSTIEINRDGKCFLRYSGLAVVFSATLDSQKLNGLWNAISYADVKSKNNAYFNEFDHGEGATFSVYFNDGTVKHISVWACDPPIEMRYLSRSIADIGQTLDWRPAAASVEFELPRVFTVLDGKEEECDCLHY